MVDVSLTGWANYRWRSRDYPEKHLDIDGCHQPCFAGLSDEFIQTGSQPLTIWIPVRGQNSSILRFWYSSRSWRPDCSSATVLNSENFAVRPWGLPWRSRVLYERLARRAIDRPLYQPSQWPSYRTRWLLIALTVPNIWPYEKDISRLGSHDRHDPTTVKALLEASPAGSSRSSGLSIYFIPKLSTLYEREDALEKDRDQIPISPCQKMTSPTPSWPTGYITEGQIILPRDLSTIVLRIHDSSLFLSFEGQRVLWSKTQEDACDHEPASLRPTPKETSQRPGCKCVRSLPCPIRTSFVKLRTALSKNINQGFTPIGRLRSLISVRTLSILPRTELKRIKRLDDWQVSPNKDYMARLNETNSDEHYSQRAPQDSNRGTSCSKIKAGWTHARFIEAVRENNRLRQR